MIDKQVIIGSGGGGGGGGKGGGGGSGGGSGVEDPDSLRSRSRAAIIDLISEGPLEPVGNILEHIYLDQTRIKDPDSDDLNVEGITAQIRDGYPDQTYIPGFTSAESEVSDNTQILEDFPYVFGINNPDADSVRIRMQFPQLTEYFKDSGDLKGTFVEFKVEIQANGGSYVDKGTIRTEGKCTSTYERSLRYDLPAGGSPWNVRVTRITPDSDRAELSNDLYIASHTIIVDGKFAYPDSGIVALNIDAQRFGSRIPSRRYFRKWLQIQVPTNYDPINRTYSGIWDGTFKLAWSNNPAWVVYDIITANRYGLGNYLNVEEIDKWALYDIGVYCDVSVPDTEGGFEPRFTFNGAITRRYDAVKLIDMMASAFRGMIYWANGAITFTQDSPKDPVRLITNANVKGGVFDYPSSARKSRRSVATVRYQDLEQLGEEGYELVINDDLVQKYGYRERSIDAFGCTSKGQARRLGEWLIDTETSEAETCVFECGLEMADLFPGEIVSIMDNDRVGYKRGGRIVSVSGTNVVLDRNIEFEAQSSWDLAVRMPDGTIETREINYPGAGEFNTFTIRSAFSQQPVDAAIYFVTSSNLQPRPFRVISVKEQKKSKSGSQWYTVSGIFYDETKYDRIERDINRPQPPFSGIPTGRLARPTDPSITESYELVGIDAASAATFAWSTNDPRNVKFEVEYKPPNSNIWVQWGETVNTSATITRTVPGLYTFRVRSKSQLYADSAWLSYSVNLAADNQDVPDVTGFLISIGNENATLTWNKITWLGLGRYEIRYSPILQGAEWESMQILIQDVPPTATAANVPARAGTYAIKAVSKSDKYSRNPTFIVSEIGSDDEKNIVVRIDEHPTWAGVKTDVIVNANSNLQLADEIVDETFKSEGLYAFSNSIDLNGISPVLVTAIIDVVLLDRSNVMATWIPISSAVPIASSAPGEWSVVIEERHSDDGIVWTDWTPLVNTKYTFRYMEYRVWLRAAKDSLTPIIRQLSIEADVEDRIVRGDDLVCPVGGLRVNYNPNFIDPPAVAITGQDLNTGDYWEVTNKDKTGFNVEFFTSGGSSKAATFDYISSGYGLQF